MQLQLGRRGFDLTTRAFTLLSLDHGEILDAGCRSSNADADIVEVGAESPSASIGQLERLRASFGGSIGVGTSDADVAAAYLAQGVDMAHDPQRFADPTYPRVIEEAGAAVLVSCYKGVSCPCLLLVERVQWARAAGIAADKIVAMAATHQLAALARIAVVMFDGGRGPDAQGVHVIGVMKAARVVRRTAPDNDVRATRRTIDTVSELLERRETTGAL